MLSGHFGEAENEQERLPHGNLSDCQKTFGMIEGSKPFDVQSETSDMCGGFGTLHSKASLHGGLAVSAPSAHEQAWSATSIKWQSHFIDTLKDCRTAIFLIDDAYHLTVTRYLALTAGV